MEVKFVIWARKADGTEFECFRWTRDEESGIMRAWRESADFGVALVEVWAVPV